MTTNPQQQQHIIKSIKPSSKTFLRDTAVEKLTQWIRTELSTKPCDRPKGNGSRLTDCRCMAFLGKDAEASKEAAEFMIKWAGLKRNDQKEMLETWHANAKFLASFDVSSKKNYRCPIPPIGPDQRTYGICLNGLCGMLGIGRKFLASPKKDHASKGKIGSESSWGKKNLEVHQSIGKFLREKLEKEAQPFPTRFIRDETGFNLRDDNPDERLLPPHMSKHGLYGEWCHSRGYIVKKKSSARSSYVPIAEFPQRDYNELDWPAGSEYKRIVSWRTFWRYWNEFFPHLKIRSRGADTCTDCLILTNSYKNSKNKSTSLCTEVSENEQDDEENTTEGISVTAEVSESEAATVIQMNEHVTAYQIQRKYVNALIKQSQDDVENNVREEERHRVLTIDMGQNLSLPNMSGNQPGDTYYMSPLSCYVTGIVDNGILSNEKESMDCYLWREFEARRGQNNIASCLLKYLKRRGWLRKSKAELAIIADNCAAQNKNRVMIRLLVWLVEVGYFSKVSLVFLVKGHTKNACYRNFNLLKIRYHKTDVYTYKQLIDVLSFHKQINVVPMEKEDFKDFLEWQDRFYRSPKGGDITKTHVFTVFGGNPTTVWKQDRCGAPVTIEDFMPTNRNKKAEVMNAEARKTAIEKMLSELKILKPPGLREIKQVELYLKWGPLMPSDEERKETCPKPSDEVLARVKDERNQKQKEKKQTKKEANKGKQLSGQKRLVDGSAKSPSPKEG